MNQATVNLTFDDEFLNRIDIIAKNESRTRADVIYNSIKIYLNHKQKLVELYSYSECLASQNTFTEEDIYTEIKNYRTNR